MKKRDLRVKEDATRFQNKLVKKDVKITIAQIILASFWPIKTENTHIY